MKYNLIECDNCHGKVQENTSIGWMEVGMLGVDTRTHKDRPLPAQFCSLHCANDYLLLTSVNKNKL